MCLVRFQTDEQWQLLLIGPNLVTKDVRLAASKIVKSLFGVLCRKYEANLNLCLSRPAKVELPSVHHQASLAKGKCQSLHQLMQVRTDVDVIFVSVQKQNDRGATKAAPRFVELEISPSIST